MQIVQDSIFSNTIEFGVVNPQRSPLPSYLQTIGYNSAQTNYAVKLEPEDVITHNRFVVPDWGALRFNLHVPEPANPTDQTSFVSVALISEDGTRYDLHSPQLDPLTDLFRSPILG